jgi:hypothetical protein
MISTILFFFSCQNREALVNKSELLGKDYRLFQNTKAWNLAKAVEDQDLDKIKQEIFKDKSIIDFQEPMYGGSLLMFAVYNNQYNSCKILLDLGADPNLNNNDRGSNAVIYAADKEQIKYLELLLKYNGNPNFVENALTKNGDNLRKTILNVAILSKDKNSLDKVKLLVKLGADVNYFRHDSGVYTKLPLADAIKVDRADIILYLLEEGADYKKPIYTRIDGDQIFILEALRQSLIDLNSVQYNYKIKVINFLKEKGLDYYKEPIPDYVLDLIKRKYPNNWKEFSKVY